MTITPTTGRIVWFSHRGVVKDAAAIITRVHSDSTVNLCVFQDGRAPYNAVAVTMDDDFPADDLDAQAPAMAWRWMPYQKAVSAERDPVSGLTRGQMDKAPPIADSIALTGADVQPATAADLAGEKASG